MSDKRMQGAAFILQAGTMNFRSRLRRDFGMGEENQPGTVDCFPAVGVSFSTLTPMGLPFSTACRGDPGAPVFLHSSAGTHNVWSAVWEEGISTVSSYRSNQQRR